MQKFGWRRQLLLSRQELMLELDGGPCRLAGAAAEWVDMATPAGPTPVQSGGVPDAARPQGQLPRSWPPPEAASAPPLGQAVTRRLRPATGAASPRSPIPSILLPAAPGPRRRTPASPAPRPSAAVFPSPRRRWARAACS
ncbi:unnamed protein product [Prorocentrum cordatum]|uniref:Uncharacterized protein n=1 Tax=Prorocentrum cordatum TaxID=2364126 RepID=A0ABN9T0W2_9DINO|nr:unnamed protein product [Polarella glacialis]